MSSRNEIITENDVFRALGQDVSHIKRQKIAPKEPCAHTLSVKAVERAVKKLSEVTGKQYKIISSKGRLEVQTIDGKYVDGGTKYNLLVARLNVLAYGEMVELAEGE